MTKITTNRTAKEFLEQIVSPCLEFWKTSPDRRNQEWLVRAVIGFMNDLIEYDALDKNIDPKTHRKKLRIVATLGIITDIANGTKHVKLKNSYKDVTNSSSAYIDDKIDSWGDIDDIVDFDNHAVFVVVLDNGESYNVDGLIEATLLYWRKALKSTAITTTNQ